MNVRTLWLTSLLVACGSGDFSGHDMPEESDEVLVSDAGDETDVGVITDETDVGVITDVTDDVEGTDTEPGTDETPEPVEGIDPLIEDFEDGIQSYVEQTRIRWSRSAATQVMGSYVQLYEEPHPAELYDRGYAAHLLAEDLTGPEGTAIAYIQGAMVADRSEDLVGDYTGIQFSACGTGSPLVRVMTELTSANCGLVSYTVQIELTDTWQVYEVAWEDVEESWYSADIEQADEETRLAYALNGGCSSVPVLGESFESTAFRGVQIELDYPAEKSIDLWVDDVAFLGGGVAGIEGEPCP